MADQTGYAGQTNLSLIGLAATGQEGFNFACQFTKDGNDNENVVLYFDHRNDVSTETVLVRLTPEEFAAFRLFVANGF